MEASEKPPHGSNKTFQPYFRFFSPKFSWFHYQVFIAILRFDAILGVMETNMNIKQGRCSDVSKRKTGSNNSCSTIRKPLAITARLQCRREGGAWLVGLYPTGKGVFYELFPGWSYEIVSSKKWTHHLESSVAVLVSVITTSWAS